MRICNVCQRKKADHKFKHIYKKTCIRCEFRWKRSFLRLLVQDRRLTAKERIASRLGYMGTSFIMMSPYLLHYIIGGVISVPQVWVAKQWNLVLVNLNVSIGYLIYFLNVE
jgi:hypothetical protein